MESLIQSQESKVDEAIKWLQNRGYPALKIKTIYNGEQIFAIATDDIDRKFKVKK